MSPTEIRTRDEWLAEVRRRGGRIRRRRRLAVAIVGTVAVVLPAGTAATLLTGHGERDVRLATAGPPAPGDVSPSTTVVELPPSTTVEVRKPAVGLNGFLAPTSPASIPPNDDPVVRSPSTASATTIPPSGPAAAAACPASDVWVSVVTDKTSYGVGEPVKATSTLQNRSATTCLVPTRAFFHVEDTAGHRLGSFAYTADFRLPVAAEPGKSFTSTVTWDQKDCAGSTCVQVPAGPYTAVAEWTEGGPYAGRGSFTVGA